MNKQKIIKIILSWILILWLLLWIVIGMIFWFRYLSKKAQNCWLETNGWNMFRRQERKHWSASFVEPKYIKIDWLYTWNFTCIGSDYSKNNTTIYFLWKPISSADYKTFEDIGSLYAKDKQNIYFEWNIISRDVKNFSLLWKNTLFARDSTSVYCRWEKIEWVDITTFTINEKEWLWWWNFWWSANDKNKKYKCGIFD